MMMKKLNAPAALLLASMTAASPAAIAAFASFQVNGAAPSPPSFTAQWAPFGLGAGGQITGLYYYSDDTLLVRTDTNGFYVRETSNNCTYGAKVYSPPCYRQGFKASNVPSMSIDLANGGGGGTEAVACPGSTNVIYAQWQGFLYISLDKAVTWKKTTLATTQTANNGNSQGPFIACDPNNPDNAIIDTGTNGVYYTNNGTGATPTFTGPITALGTGVSHVFAFVQGSSTDVLACRTGTGCYRSTTGISGTFTLTSSGPTTVYHLEADKCGRIWAANGTTTVYRISGATWTSFAAGGSGSIYTVATDPSSTCGASFRVAAMFSTGNPNVSTNDGTSWTGQWFNQTTTAPAGQPTWLSVANQQGGSGSINLNGYSAVFDNSGNLRFGGGLGVWKLSGPVSTGDGVNWAADTLGIEQLVVNKLISPPGVAPIAAVWDKGMMRNLNPWNFPATYYENAIPTDPIQHAWSADWSSSGNYVVTWQQGNSYKPSTSSDGGATYSVWSAANPGAGNGGDIAALNGSKYLLQPGLGQPLSYTLNGAGSFAASTITGSPTDWSTGTGVGWGLAASRTAANVYCAIRTNKTVYYSSDSGQTLNASGVTGATIDGSPNLFFLRGANNTGDFWYTAGGQGGAHPANTHLWKLTTTTNPCDTATNVNANIREVIAIGFGALPPAGGGYGTMVYFYGWYNGTLGFWKSTDGLATAPVAIDVPASETPYPLDSMDLVTWLEGDPDIYGRINVGFRGSGGAYIDTQDACPWVSFTNVVPGQSLSGTSVSVTAIHSGKVPATSANLYVDNTIVGTSSGTTLDGTTTYSFTLNATANAGSRTLRIEGIGNGCVAGGGGNRKSMPATLSWANDNELSLRGVA